MHLAFGVAGAYAHRPASPYTVGMTSRPGLRWAAAATAMVLGAASWLNTPSMPTLLASAATTVLIVAVTIMRPRTWYRAAFAVSSSAFVLVAALAERSRGGDRKSVV